MVAASYSRLERAFHRLALHGPGVRALSFDLECALTGTHDSDIVDRPHVFVSGLARSGTTILLRALHSSGRLATLSYRDMPFVLAPGLWSRLSRHSRRQGRLQERSHADGLAIGFDTPEAFEEVFWLTFCGDGYVRDDRLCAHDADDDDVERFRRYVGNVIAAHGRPGETRYLSKNNNNLLRLPLLKRIFPAAGIVIPFRDPHAQAASLLRQHRNFTRMHAEDPYAERYMSWLGHFEFGCNLKPFRFDGPARAPLDGDRDTIEFWLAYWAYVYGAVLERAPDDAIFLAHERLCERPRRVFAALARRIGIDGGAMEAFAGNIAAPARSGSAEAADRKVRERARTVHRSLLSRAL